MNTELSDLYYYLESKTIHHPTKGIIQYRLFPFQHDFLRAVHDNNRLLIIKGRQIGASTMLAGYLAWRFSRSGDAAVINACKHVCAEELHKKVRWFEPEYPKLYTDGRGLGADLYVYDEWNYNAMCGQPYDHTRFLQPGKHIITGTVDPRNKLYNLYCELVARFNPYNVVWFPISRCRGAWEPMRVDNIRPMFTSEQWRQEMECQWE